MTRQVCARCDSDLTEDVLRHVDEGGPGHCSRCSLPFAVAGDWLRQNGYETTEDTMDEQRIEELSEEELDELVHEAKGHEAAEINNGGRDSQLAYLREFYGLEERRADVRLRTGRDRHGFEMEPGDRVRYEPDPTMLPEQGVQEGRGTVRGFVVSPDDGRTVADIDDDAGGDTTWRYLPEVESVTAGALEAVRDSLSTDDDDAHEALAALALAGEEAGGALSHARTLLDDPGGAESLPQVLDRIDRAIGRLRRAGVLS